MIEDDWQPVPCRFIEESAAAVTAAPTPSVDVDRCSGGAATHSIRCRTRSNKRLMQVKYLGAYHPETISCEESSRSEMSTFLDIIKVKTKATWIHA